MKMNIFKYLGVMAIAIASYGCVEDSAPEDQFASSSNLVGFTSTSENMGVKADGSEYSRQLTVSLFGASVDGISGDISATVLADASSTAIEGTHYRLESTSVTLTEDQGYIANIDLTILSEGIVAPLAASPVLSLVVGAVTASGNVVASGKAVDVSINYLCNSLLAGEYTLSIVRDGTSVSVFDETLTSIGEGVYRGLNVGTWGPGAIGGTPGFTFYDVCNVITLPQQDLVDLYSNQVIQAGDSFVDPDTGIITIHYGIYSTWESEYLCTYTPK